MESDQTSRRVKRAKLEQRRNGVQPGGSPAFGWRRSVVVGPDGKEISVDETDPVEKQLVIEAADRVLAGETMAAVAREFNARGVKTKQGGTRWFNKTIRAMLRNPRHGGLIPHNGQAFGEAKWDPILPRDRWEQLQAVLDARGNRAVAPRRTSMLTGLVRCHCGGTMTRDRHGETRMAWRCLTKPGYRDCGHNRIPAVPLEELVRTMVVKIVDDADLANQASRRPNAGAKLAAELADLEIRERALGESFAAGKLTLRAFESASASIAGQQQALRSRLAARADASVLGRYVGRQGALEAAWDDLTTDRQRAVIAAALDLERVRVVVGPGRGWDDDRVRLEAR
jgi:hypothetical protein